MKRKNNSEENKIIDNYQKRGFIKNLPFWFKATFIKYWFYGALYFFCFMGLGLTGIPNENLVIVTSLIGGVLFDIALYNIFLLFAETREEASKWWFFKSKKFYSFLINIAVILGIMFAFYYTIVPIKEAIKAAMGENSPFWWLFQEPLSAALLLVSYDTAICWIKNGSIILVKKIFKLGDYSPAKKANYIKILDISCVSVTISLNENSNYYSKNPYNVFLDNEVILKKVNTNVLTIYDLKPDTQYKITINKQNIIFTTAKILKFYKVFEGNDIQNVIDNADQYSLIIVNKGTYKIKSLDLKNNITLYFRKGAILTLSEKEEDYPIIKDEIYSKYESTNIKSPIINLSNVKGVKLIAEGELNGENQKQINSPQLIYINHSTDISIVGLTLNNSSNYPINTFFSNNINLLNLNISNSLNKEAISVICSDNINIIGCHLLNTLDSISIKSGNVDFANIYHTPSKEIIIKNCLIENSLSSITFSNECAFGIYSISVSHCLFNKNNYGFLLRSNINNGNDSIIKDITLHDITMDKVHAPIVINMLHGQDLNKVINKTNNKNLPYINNFVFNNIIAKDYIYTPGFFYGLSEKYIGEINIINSIFTSSSEVSSNYLNNKMEDIYKCNKVGFIVKNVRSFVLTNVKVNNFVGKKIDYENVGEIIDK